MLDAVVLTHALLIIVARVIDVSLGTLRTICIIQGRGAAAWFLGFFEVLVWVVAAGSVLGNLSNPVYAIAYAIGYATGSLVGVRIEQYFAFGEQVVRILTRIGRTMPTALREAGFGVTEFNGEGRDGLIKMLLVKTPRRKVATVLRIADQCDPRHVYYVDDIRPGRQANWGGQQSTGWRGVFKKK